MHFLRLFFAFIQKLCLLSFIFPKINKRGGWNKSGGGGLENFSKSNKRGGGTIIRYSRVYIVTCMEREESRRHKKAGINFVVVVYIVSIVYMAVDILYIVRRTIYIVHMVSKLKSFWCYGILVFTHSNMVLGVAHLSLATGFSEGE